MTLRGLSIRIVVSVLTFEAKVDLKPVDTFAASNRSRLSADALW